MTKIKENNMVRFIPLLILPLLAGRVGNGLEPWIRMWLLAFALYAGCKLLTIRDIPVNGGKRDRWAYLLGWPGMNPVPFLQADHPDQEFLKLWILGFRNILIGCFLLFGMAPRWVMDTPRIATWMAMTGFIFLLHFGLFHLLAGFWQKMGFGAEPIMNRPIQSKRVAEFWGFRWNRAFQVLTWHYIFNPLRKKVSPVLALWISFAASGLIHEVVITVPAGGGYGGPSLYFLIQALAVMVERRWTVLKFPGIGWGWTMTVVLLPAGLLFPVPFLERVMMPMFSAMGLFPAGVLL